MKKEVLECKDVESLRDIYSESKVEVEEGLDIAIGDPKFDKASAKFMTALTAFEVAINKEFPKAQSGVSKAFGAIEGKVEQIKDRKSVV